MLAHINPQEASLLKALGGSGTINPDTGLPEYFWDEVVDDFLGIDDDGGVFGSALGVADNLLGIDDSGGVKSVADDLLGIDDRGGVLGSINQNINPPAEDRSWMTPAADAPWKTGYDNLIKQMSALQSKVDVYKGPSPLPVDRHMQTIAANLARDYGINSISDIGVRTDTYYDDDGSIVEGRDKIFFNKNDPAKIIPQSFASDNQDDGYSVYSLLPIPDGKGGNVAVPVNRYSKSGWGEFAQDIAPIVPIINAIAIAAGAPPILVAAANVGFQYGAGNIKDLADAIRVAGPILAADAGIVGAVGKMYTAYQAFDKGDVISGLSTVASALGMGGLANDLRFVNAVKTGNVPGALIALGNMSGVTNYQFKDELGNPIIGLDGKPVTLSNYKIGGQYGLTLPDLSKSVAIAANLLSDNPNYGLALQMAGELKNSPDTATAGKAISLIEALSNPNVTPASVYQAAMSFANGVNSRSPNMAPIENRIANEAIRASNGSTDSKGSSTTDPATKVANDNDLLVSDLGVGSTIPIRGGADTKVTTGDTKVTTGGTDTKVTTDGTTTTTGGTTTPTYNSPFSVKIGDKEYDLDNMGGASTKNTDGTITKLNATQFAALGEPAITVSDLYNMDAYLGATGEYIYKDSSGTSYFVDDDGDVQSLTKQQADSLVLPDTKKYTGTLDPVKIVGNRYKESIGYDWFPNLKTTTTTSGINTITTDSIKALPTDSIKALPTDSIKALPTDNINTITTDSIKALPTDKVGTIGSGNIGTIGGGNTGTLTTTNTGTLTTKNTGTLTTDQISALTTTEPRGLQALPTSDARYWRQTGATGTGGKGGVRFFDWYDTPENRTMAPPAMTTASIPAMTTATFVALTSQQVGTIAPPVAKRYFNAETNRYYTDPTGTWQPPAGWAQIGLKGGGEVKTKHFYNGGYSDFDSPIELRGIEYGGGSMSDEDVYSYLRSLPSDNSWTGYNFDTSGIDFGDLNSAIGSDFSGSGNYFGYEDGVMSEDDVDAYLRSLPSENASYGDPEDPRNENYGNEGRAYSGKNAIDPVTGSPINAKTGVPNRSLKPNPLKGLADAAKRNPDLMKMLLGAGLGGLLGYMGRPKGIKPKGMQGLGLSQGQVYGALKGKSVQRAEGGEIDGYAGGGGLSYLKSAEDGMADKIPATIDNKQPAKLSGGEFVIPADVVSHLGNGNSEAGAKRLYEMMDRIRHARTGTKKQGKQINPAKFTPK
jgi:hypothetical protein